MAARRALPEIMTDAPASPSRRVTPGCLMFIVAAVWLLVLGGWMIWSLYAQLKEIRTFADTAARPVSVAQPTAEQISALRSRINTFGADVGKTQKASLRLTVDDLNNLLASEEQAKGMKENTKVESIGETIRVQISVAMNGVPFTGERLYLNGFADLAPEKDPGKGVRLLTRNLTIPGKTVTAGFLDHYKENNHLDTLLMDGLRKSSDPAVMQVLKKVTTVRLEPGAAVVEYAP
jgi:hypothetical protein